MSGYVYRQIEQRNKRKGGIMKQVIKTVVDLSGYERYTYMDCTAEQAIITQYLINSKQGMNIHSMQARARARALIISNRLTLSLGDFSVMRDDYKL